MHRIPTGHLFLEKEIPMAVQTKKPEVKKPVTMKATPTRKTVRYVKATTSEVLAVVDKLMVIHDKALRKLRG
jgi:hypothetical protein